MFVYCNILAVQLWPVTELSKVMLKSITSKCLIVHSDGVEKFFLDAPKQGRTEDSSKWPKDSVFAAYWQVHYTGEMEEVNLKVVKVLSGDWEFPILVNTKKLKPFDRLCVFDKTLKEKAEAAAAKKRKLAMGMP